jgi:hypothetical protein
LQQQNFRFVDSDSGDIPLGPDPGAAALGGAGVKVAENRAGLAIGRRITASLGYNTGLLWEAAANAREAFLP